MLTIIVIILLIAVIFLAVMIILLWSKLNKGKGEQVASSQEEIVPTKKEIQAQEQNVVQTENKPKAEPRRTKIPKPNISPNARLETLTEAYTNLAGVIGALISDRFGQTIAVDTNLFIDKNTVSAQFVEILAMSKSDKLSLGKSRNVLMVGEGSYWIFSDVATLPIGLWLERDISLNDGIELFKNFKMDVVNALKKYYTKIW